MVASIVNRTNFMIPDNAYSYMGTRIMMHDLVHDLMFDYNVNNGFHVWFVEDSP